MLTAWRRSLGLSISTIGQMKLDHCRQPMTFKDTRHSQPQSAPKRDGKSSVGSDLRSNRRRGRFRPKHTGDSSKFDEQSADDVRSDGGGGQGRPSDWRKRFDRFASYVTKHAGAPSTFVLAFVLVLVWGISGPLFGFSETWQLIINTGTTIVTFLMVFLIQQSQNKDSKAVHLKLDEIIRSLDGADDELIDIEDLSEQQIRHLASQMKCRDEA